MALLKSISGIRGTLGGVPGETLSPLDVLRFTAAFCQWAAAQHSTKKIVLGRDGRTSGPLLSQLVSNTAQSLGFEIIDLGLSTTPTVEMVVPKVGAAGGIILTASHNPGNWNALKLLNAEGEFLSAEAGKAVLEAAEKEDFHFVAPEEYGKIIHDEDYLDFHIQEILKLPWVKPEQIRARKFRVLVDGINSSGAVAMPRLLKALGVEEVGLIYGEPHGRFERTPEPLPENLVETCEKTKAENYDFAIVVDPDVDRLAFICEDGNAFGEEYTLVAVADYILREEGGGNTVSNLSSTRALAEITAKHGGEYTASAVGEVNVVAAMKAKNAVIGGEGNGGVIVPQLHYGRDALAGAALFLSALAETDESLSTFRKRYPNYAMTKAKAELTPELDVDAILETVAEKYKNKKVNRVDGVKVDFPEGWVHLRKSNTEPIVRVYAEGETTEVAEQLAQRFLDELQQKASA